MGAWGHNSFENDDALDWVVELEKSKDTTIIFESLDLLINNKADEIEAEDCSIAIAAAEVVAALYGNGSSLLPERVSNWLKGKPKPTPSLIAKAQQVIDAILSDSELKELWKESPNDYPKWVSALKDLKSRLY